MACCISVGSKKKMVNFFPLSPTVLPLIGPPDSLNGKREKKNTRGCESIGERLGASRGWASRFFFPGRIIALKRKEPGNWLCGVVVETFARRCPCYVIAKRAVARCSSLEWTLQLEKLAAAPFLKYKIPCITRTNSSPENSALSPGSGPISGPVFNFSPLYYGQGILSPSVCGREGSSSSEGPKSHVRAVPVSSNRRILAC